MKNNTYLNLSRRESQIMDIIYRLSEASVADVLEALPDPPGYNSVRVILSILEKKGYLLHKKEGQKYVYTPTELPEKTKRSVLEHLMTTFFEDSTPQVLSTLLDMSASELSDEELDELSEMIEKARKEKTK